MTRRPATSPVRPGEAMASLDRERRARDRDRLAAGEPVDVLVVGAGVTGAGVALDAASRGLSVALLERHDLAHGTSRWSSKLVHGGLRYLAKGDLGIAWESAVERHVLATTVAPHLMSAVPQLVPVLADDVAYAPALTRAGLLGGDLIRRGARTPGSVIPRSRHVTRAEALRLAPALDPARTRGGLVTWEERLEDDARLVVAITRTAAAFGARVLTRAAVRSMGAGGAVVEDLLDDGTFEVRARHVVNATGVWAGELDPSVRLTPSRGTHLVLRAETLGYPTASLTVPVPGHFGRFVFAIPQPDGLVYLGLTDVPAEGPLPDVPVPSAEEITWLRETASLALARPIAAVDVVGSFAGLRPLLAPAEDSADGAGADRSADLSRRHAVLAHGDGTMTVTGGKLTTYRRMAQDAVDRITEGRCRTRTLPLVGAGAVAGADRLPARLVRRYGSEAPVVWALGEDRPWLRSPVAAGIPVLGVELAFGVVAEGALDVADLLERRTRLALVPADAARATEAALDVMSGATAPVP
jgi:glycerol-3-phosphate dehydrogenase